MVLFTKDNNTTNKQLNEIENFIKRLNYLITGINSKKLTLNAIFYELALMLNKINNSAYEDIFPKDPSIRDAFERILQSRTIVSYPEDLIVPLNSMRTKFEDFIKTLR